MKPIYNENIIVGVVYQGIWQWYVTDKDLWYLDLLKFKKGYEDKGLQLNQSELNDRFGILTVDQNTASPFLNQLKGFKVSSNELVKLLLNDQYDSVLDLSPSLYVNFDKKELYSMYPEPASYEDYVPEDWKGEYEDFTNLIPNEEVYWKNNGNNILAEKFRGEE